MRNVNPKKDKVVFVNRYFYPDYSATSQILSDLSFYMASSGFAVEIITSRLNYADSNCVLQKTDVVNNVKIHRVWTTRFGRHNLLGRSIDYMSFYVSSFIFMLMHLNKSDILIAKTDPPLISIIASLVCKLKGCLLINWTQDLFPEVAKSLGVKGVGLVYSLLVYLRNMSLKYAYSNVVIGEKMSDIIQANGVKKEKIKVIHNWSINDDIVPIDSSINPLRSEWNLENKFIVGYSGNIGRAHEFETLINTAIELSSNEKIAFLIIGGGAQYDSIKSKVEKLNLNNFIFKPYQSHDQLQYSLTLPDLHVISLLPELEGLIVPSKFYGIAASGRPVLYIGSCDGEIPRIIKNYECGKTIEIGDYSTSVSYIEDLVSNNELALKAGVSCRKLYDEVYNKKNSFKSWLEVLEPLMNTR